MEMQNELSFPDELRYTKDHEWVRLEDDRAVAGLTDFAQNQLGDLTFVDLPEKGDSFEEGEEFAAVESAKAAVDLIMPLSGEIVEVNPLLSENPRLVNSSPYDQGWLVQIEPDDVNDLDKLMDVAAYIRMLQPD